MDTINVIDKIPLTNIYLYQNQQLAVPALGLINSQIQLPALQAVIGQLQTIDVLFMVSVNIHFPQYKM
jgi:hypothetical protein